MRSSVRGLNS